MLEGLSDRLQGIVRNLTGRGRINEAVLDESMREIRMALLEADVHISVVKALVAGVKERALGEDVFKSLTPGQQVVKIVKDELEFLLGEKEDRSLKFASKPPTVIMMVGLQGSGKTTTAAKLGLALKKQGKYPYLVPADVYRPAAIEQLVRVGETAGLKVYEHDGTRTPLEICKAGVLEARRRGFDTVILDTAGRLHIDETLMGELTELKEHLAPQEILFVADSMTGQDAVRSAAEFHEIIQLSGVVLTKMDGDSRGGAALSIRHVTGVPIKFIGTGERPSEFEAFHPDRLVGRILGMGDVLTLIEKAEENIDQAEAVELEKKLSSNQFTLEDFRSQIRMVKKMGPLSGLVSMLPGMGQVRDADLDSNALVRVTAILDTMTPRERLQPQILNTSRKKRIARGAGRNIPEINRLLKQFAKMKKMMKQVKNMKKGRKGMPNLPFFGK